MSKLIAIINGIIQTISILLPVLGRSIHELPKIWEKVKLAFKNA